MTRRWCLALGVMLGCPTAPGEPGESAETGEGTTGEGSETTTGTTLPEPTSPTSPTTPSITASATSPATSVTAADTTGDSDPLPPNELECDDQLDDDGDEATDCYDADCWDRDVCADRFVRVATWNVRTIGAPGTDQQAKFISVAERIDADILCLQEVGDEEDAIVEQVAAAAGYDHFAFAPSGRPSGGMIRNACLSRHEIVQWDALDDTELSTDPDASDIARAILRVRIRLEPLDRYLTVLAAHLKARTADTDRFRRMVEAIRLGIAVELEREIYPNNAIIALGDFNETPDHPAAQWSAPPDDLPFAYRLGDDIALPMSYEPFAPVEAAGLDVVHARVEDSDFDDTYLPDLVRLDYIYEDAADVVVSEVYEACEDDGIDGFPRGDRMPKAGEPLPCGANGDASDHRPVVAVFYFAP